jgi:hypothetical protein
MTKAGGALDCPQEQWRSMPTSTINVPSVYPIALLEGAWTAILASEEIEITVDRLKWIHSDLRGTCYNTNGAPIHQFSATGKAFNYFFLCWPARICTRRILKCMAISPRHALRKEWIHSQNVDYIELETNCLDNRISLHCASLYHSRVGKNLLRTISVKCM